MKRTIIRAAQLGFCFGVERVLKLTNEMIDVNAPEPRGTLGPLIHNDRVIERLEARGIITYPADALPDRGSLVIRAHGVPRDLQQQLEKNPRLNLINGTCPRVVRNQKQVQAWSDQGFHVVILGDADHGEIVSLASYARSCDIVLGRESLERLQLPEKCALIAQTTLKESEWEEGLTILRKKRPDIEAFKSICRATRDRQEALEKLCTQVEAVVVIGGGQSANTRRLLEKVREAGLPGWQVTGAADIPTDELQPFSRLGISAGASTPGWIIDEVEEALSSL